MYIYIQISIRCSFIYIYIYIYIFSLFLLFVSLLMFLLDVTVYYTYLLSFHILLHFSHLDFSKCTFVCFHICIIVYFYFLIIAYFYILQETADLVTFTKEILNGKLHFWYSKTFLGIETHTQSLITSYNLSNYSGFVFVEGRLKTVA